MAIVEPAPVALYNNYKDDIFSQNCILGDCLDRTILPDDFIFFTLTEWIEYSGAEIGV